jgi:hypothetical protein
LHGLEQRGGGAFEPSAVAAAVGAADFESMRAASRANDALPLATAMRAIAESIEAQVHADQRRRRSGRRLEASTNALDCGACCGTFAWTAGPGGKPFEFCETFGDRIEGGHGCPLSSGAHRGLATGQADAKDVGELGG